MSTTEWQTRVADRWLVGFYPFAANSYKPRVVGPVRACHSEAHARRLLRQLNPPLVVVIYDREPSVTEAMGVFALWEAFERARGVVSIHLKAGE